MTTMMEHPKHGRHPATGHEVAHMKTLGWTVCPPKVKGAQLVPMTQEHVDLAVREGMGQTSDVRFIESDYIADPVAAPRRRGPNKRKG